MVNYTCINYLYMCKVAGLHSYRFFWMIGKHSIAWTWVYSFSDWSSCPGDNMISRVHSFIWTDKVDASLIGRKIVNCEQSVFYIRCSEDSQWGGDIWSRTWRMKKTDKYKNLGGEFQIQVTSINNNLIFLSV